MNSIQLLIIRSEKFFSSSVKITPEREFVIVCDKFEILVTEKNHVTKKIFEKKFNLVHFCHKMVAQKEKSSNLYDRILKIQVLYQSFKRNLSKNWTLVSLYFCQRMIFLSSDSFLWLVDKTFLNSDVKLGLLTFKKLVQRGTVSWKQNPESEYISKLKGLTLYLNVSPGHF